jgi:transcriptional regulator with XRE-family HTH domain
MTALADLAIPDLASSTGYRPVSAIHSHRPPASQLLPTIGAAGTGGVESGDYYRRMYLLPIGYQAFLVVVAPAQAPDPAPYTELMQVIKSGFGRTMTRLPEVFGVSRQTLYNWLNGETPKPAHQEKLRQLAEAARIFSALGFKPTSLALDRTITQGKSLLQLLSEGADGGNAAKKLVRIVQRGNEARAKLDEMLGGRKARLEASDVGTPSLDEDA